MYTFYFGRGRDHACSFLLGNTFVVVSVCDRERKGGKEGEVSCKIIKKGVFEREREKETLTQLIVYRKLVFIPLYLFSFC